MSAITGNGRSATDFYQCITGQEYCWASSNLHYSICHSILPTIPCGQATINEVWSLFILYLMKCILMTLPLCTMYMYVPVIHIDILLGTMPAQIILYNSYGQVCNIKVPGVVLKNQFASVLLWYHQLAISYAL